MKEYIKEKLKEKAIDKKALEKYFKVIEYFENNGVRDNYYSFHHIYPSFLYKQELGAKNRSYTIDKLDEDYPPEDNVIKIDNQGNRYRGEGYNPWYENELAFGKDCTGWTALVKKWWNYKG